MKNWRSITGEINGATLWPGFKGFRGFGLPLAGWFKGLWIALTGNIYKVSVTD